MWCHSSTRLLCHCIRWRHPGSLSHVAAPLPQARWAHRRAGYLLAAGERWEEGVTAFQAALKTDVRDAGGWGGVGCRPRAGLHMGGGRSVWPASCTVWLVAACLEQDARPPPTHPPLCPLARSRVGGPGQLLPAAGPLHGCSQGLHARPGAAARPALRAHPGERVEGRRLCCERLLPHNLWLP